MQEQFKGIGASAGIAVGKAVCLSQEVELNRKQIGQQQIEREIELLNSGLEKYKHGIYAIIEKAREQLPADELAILETYDLIIEDPALLRAMQKKIRTEQKNASWAADEAFNSYIQTLASLPSENFKQRAVDVEAIRRGVLALLSGREIQIEGLHPGSVIVAEDLGPSETMSLDRSCIAALVTQKGGRTSHTSILARALGIPAVVGAHGIMEKARNGDCIIVDANEGKVLLCPTQSVQAEYADKIHDQEVEINALKQLATAPTMTLDGRSVELWANVSGKDDVLNVLSQGAQGIGLFRTEFLYMAADALPTEEEQEAAYRAILHAMQGKPVVIRTLDIGADKRLSYFPMPEEENPALGCRAIRLCLKERDIFRVQLRALLKASVAGNLWIMFPMIATPEELQEATNLLEAARHELEASGIPVSQNIKIGIMIEIPAAAINADLFAERVDFFSIGTNDLIQYLFAADRQNRDVDYLYQPLNRAVLRLISQVVAAGHAQGIPVGMCGEMAGDPSATEVLIGLGLDELSMASGSILPVKKQLRTIDARRAEKVARAMMGRLTQG